jgi:hypothetical protein
MCGFVCESRCLLISIRSNSWLIVCRSDDSRTHFKSGIGSETLRQPFHMHLFAKETWVRAWVLIIKILALETRMDVVDSPQLWSLTESLQAWAPFTLMSNSWHEALVRVIGLWWRWTARPWPFSWRSIRGGSRHFRRCDWVWDLAQWMIYLGEHCGLWVYWEGWRIEHVGRNRGVVPVKVNIQASRWGTSSIGHVVLAIYSLTWLSPREIFGFRIEIVHEGNGFETGKRRNLIVQRIGFDIARARVSWGLILTLRNIRLSLVAWDGWWWVGEIQVIVNGEIGLRWTRGDNVKIGTILKAPTVNYQSRSIVGDVAMAGLRDPAKTRLGKSSSRRPPRPRRGGSNWGRKSFQVLR